MPQSGASCIYCATITTIASCHCCCCRSSAGRCHSRSSLSLNRIPWGGNERLFARVACSSTRFQLSLNLLAVFSLSRLAICATFPQERTEHYQPLLLTLLSQVNLPSRSSRISLHPNQCYRPGTRQRALRKDAILCKMMHLCAPALAVEESQPLPNQTDQRW